MTKKKNTRTSPKKSPKATKKKASRKRRPALSGLSTDIWGKYAWGFQLGGKSPRRELFTAFVKSESGSGHKKPRPQSLDTRKVEAISLEGHWEELPEWILDFKNLVAIQVRGAELKDISLNLSSLTHLQVLSFRDNRITFLPKWLLSSKTTYLNISGNPKLPIPKSVITTGDTQKILRYYFESIREKGRPLGEVKLLLVGRGQAGKTTLLKRLTGRRPNKREPETHSISIRQLRFNCKKGRVQARAWDFGGQEILHATHQFFLTERSLYLLVLEPRTGSHQKDAEYWLNLIGTQGNSSPVIVVTNYSHKRRWDVDRVKLKRTYPFIVDFVATDAMYGDGIEKLRKTISTAINDMPDVWLPFPSRWRKIKQAVSGMEENFLAYQEYTNLCIRHREHDPEAQSDLAEILHALGLALYFGKDPRLYDTRVLNPSWVTGGVYAVIRSSSVKERDGQFSPRNMLSVLREAQEKTTLSLKDYPLKSRKFILDLMLAFQLCYTSPTEDSRSVRYLVPELLPEFEPAMSEDWSEAPVRLRYSYRSLPEGLLPRFIVRTHALGEGGAQWRRGVVLSHGSSKALIRAETDRPELSVFILGDDEEQRTTLVAMVRDELDSLHGELKMSPVEYLALTDEDDRWISVRSLLEIENPRKKNQKLPVLPDGTAKVNVFRELNKLVPSTVRKYDRNPRRAPRPVRLFVSYSSEDERQLKRLDSILSVLERQHGLTPWNDKRLVAGEDFDEIIRERLEEMDIFLFVASQASLVSKYILDVELRIAKRRHRKKELQIVCVMLEPCALEDERSLSRLQRLGDRKRSVAQTTPRSAAWEAIRLGLLPVIDKVRMAKKEEH